MILVAGQLKYKSWQYQDVTVNVRKNNAFSTEVRRKRVIVECEKPIEEALECLAKAVDEPNIHTNLRKHLFVADWENKQFEQLKLDIRPGDVLCVMDFAQNYTTINQDAIKSDHYGKQQITIHPIPCYYRRKEGSLVRESVMIVSDNLNHDAQAVSAFQKYLRSKYIDVKHLIEWCDSSPLNTSWLRALPTSQKHQQN